MSSKLIQIVALLLAVGLAAASSRFARPINEGRKALSMISEENPLEEAPPEYAFAVQAFGAFRGLLTNLAFIRAEELKMAGRYYDAMNLASWISKLQPHFVSVWEFLAWNMAWNISVTTYTPEERWNWVYNGVKLLRDEGIKYNPRAVNLYKQLAWIFVNKMSESVDEHHMAYKRNWAWRMHLLLGPPPDPLGEYRPKQPFKELDAHIGDAGDLLADATHRENVRREEVKKAKERGEAETSAVDVDAGPRAATGKDAFELPGFEVTKKAFYDAMKKIADAPKTLDELYAQAPATRDLVEALRGDGIKISDERMIEDEYWSPTGLAFKFFYPYRVLTDPPALLGQILREKARDPRAQQVERFDEIMGIRKGNPAAEALVRFVQKKTLHDVYKMDAAKMAELIAIFGPVDWRVVDAHSLYWVNEGLIAGDETISTFRNDKTNTARLLFFSLRNLASRNRLTFEPYTDNINLSYINFNPDLNFIEPMHQAYLTYGKDIDPEPTATGIGETFRAGHVNFLEEAIRLLYFAGRTREAQHYYDYLRENYGRDSNGQLEAKYSKTMQEHIHENWGDILGSWAQTRLIIGARLQNSFTTLAQGNVAEYMMLTEWAKSLRDNYVDSLIRTDSNPEHKLQLPQFSEMQVDALVEWLRQPAMSVGASVIKTQLWLYLPLYLKLPAYDAVQEVLARECEAMGFDLAKAFPPPPGIEEYRKTHPRREPVKPPDEVETPAQNFD